MLLQAKTEELEIATSMGRAIKIAVGIILGAAVAFGIFSGGSCYLHSRKLEQGSAQITAGTSKKRVVELLGEPKEIDVCRPRGEERKDIYFYYSFLQKWGFVFDRDDNVKSTFYNGGFF